MTLRTRLSIGAVLLLALGLLAEWALRAPPAEPPAATQQAPAQSPAPPPAEAARPPAAAAPEGEALSSSVPPQPAEAEEDEAVRGVPHDNDPIEPELPQTPEWKLEKTAHLHGLLDRHVARLEAERAAAQAAGRQEEAKRLEVATARAQRRLERLQEEMASLRAQAGVVAAQ
jgi:hypothetical protein